MWKGICNILLLLCGVVIVFFLLFIYPFRYIHEDFDIGMFKGFSQDFDNIKSGDLYFTRHCEMGLFDKIRWGTRLTHAGLFHRCQYSGRLFIFDIHRGLNYILFEDAMKMYKGHAFIRQKREPLTEQQLTNFQSVIDRAFSGHNKLKTTQIVTSRNDGHNQPMCHNLQMNRTNDQEYPFDSTSHADWSVLNCLKPCAQQHLFKQKNSGYSPFGIICPDLMYLFLQRWGVLSKKISQSCSKPDWFAYPHEQIDKAYFPLTILKNYETCHKEEQSGENIIRVNDFSFRL